MNDELQSAMSGRGTWIAFLAMAFGIVGLSGLFATYALSVPWQRAALEITALDGDGSVTSRITAALGPEAAQQIAAAGVAPEAALRSARATVLKRAEEDATSATVRTRWMIVVVTAMGAVFGTAILGIGQGSGRPAGR
ncbi:MAG TPA: hypothetical protein VJY39_18740 [Acidisphaera sp.]|nr:hypothetical protein [Acidisphaera sp.]